MPSDSVLSFLELARDNRLLPPDRLEQLLETSGVPQEGLGPMCDALVERGMLTAFQAARIREGRGRELAFAGYPILDDLGPCPGGHAFQANHPSLRTAIVLRRLQTEWLAPADNLSAFIQRAQQASTVTHENLAALLDAGAYQEQLFVVLDPMAGANLETLVRDIGPMPAFLACLYIRQAAMAILAARPTGLFHGAIRPANLHVAPLIQSSRRKADGTPLFRPGPASALKLAEYGLIPRRPVLLEWIATTDVAPNELAFVAPERAIDPEYREPGDVYSLGMSLYYLLTGRTPFVEDSATGMVGKITVNQPFPLASLRPDLPPALVEFVAAMTAKAPTARPDLTATIEQLANHLAPALPADPVRSKPDAAGESCILSGSSPVSLVAADSVAATPEPTLEPNLVSEVVVPSEWAVTPYEGSVGDGELLFAPAAPQADAHASDEQRVTDFTSQAPSKRRRGMTDAEARQAKKKWLMIALGLWIVSIPLWIILLYTWGVIGGSKQTADPTPIKKRR